jgi:hypothetical protein
MGMFAETAIVVYRLSFAGQGKQSSVFCFRLQQINGSLPFLFSVFSEQTDVESSAGSVFHLQNSINVETWT